MLCNLIPAIGFGWAVRAVALVALALAAAALAVLLPQLADHTGPMQHRRALLDLRALREPSFVLFALALPFNYVVFYVPPFYVSTYATTVLGQTRDFAFEALVFISVGSLIGRTVPMLAAAYVGSIVVYLAGTAMAAAILFSWVAVSNVGGLITICLMYGTASGILVAAPSASMSHTVLLPDMSVVGTRMGMGWMFGGVGVLIGAPIAGALANFKPEQIDFKPAQGFAGAALSVASMLDSPARLNRTI
jgi:predicted MFS family arabinose efflux permease